MNKVLMFEDNPLYGFAMASVLKRNGFRVEQYDRPDQAMYAINHGSRYDVLLTDLSSTNSLASGDDIAEVSKKVNPDVPVFSMSTYEEFHSPYVNVHLSKSEPIPRLVDYIKRYLI